jgi:hypothetical protein
MSVPKQSPIACSHCKTEQPFAMWESLNVTLHPELKDKLLANELTLFTCNHCGWSGQVVYPFLYHDMAEKLMIWFWPAEGEPDTKVLPEAMKDYRLRIVGHRNDLREKIYLFDAGLDDRVLEFLKLLVRAKSGQEGRPLEGQIYFAPSAGPELAFEHVVDDRSDAFKIDFPIYESVAESLADKLMAAEAPGEWLHVGPEYAAGLAKRS